MSNSGQGPVIYANLIDRKNRIDYVVQPKIKQLSYGTDMRQFTGAFDFEIQFGPFEKVSINSHDYIEFFFYLGNQKHQIGVGFIEDFVKHTSAEGNVFQGNGRDLLAQIMLFPFKTRTYKNGISYQQFLNLSLENTYLLDYLSMKNRSSNVVDFGMYKKQMIFTDVITAPRAQIVQEYAELAQNLVYQDRFGRMVVYGRSHRNAGATNVTLNAYSDHNVDDMMIRENFSKVFSEASVIYQGQELLDLSDIKRTSAASSIQKNSDPRAAGLNQPTYKIFSAQDLVGLAGQKSDVSRIDDIAKGIIRKSNQFLSQPVVISNAPYYVDTSGKKFAYEVGQVFRLISTAHNVNDLYKVAGIHYEQNDSQTKVQIAFVEPDTLV